MMVPTEQRAQQGTNTGTGSGSRPQKLWCYLVCLLALLLTLSPSYVYQPGLCILLVFSVLAAARWVWPAGSPVGRRHLLWLFLGLGWSAGVLACGDILVCAACFCVSLLCWAMYLGCCACAEWEPPMKEVPAIAFQSMFFDPWAFFEPDPSRRQDQYRRRLAWRIYAAYIVAAVLVLMILLFIQAESRIDGLLRVTLGFAWEKAPLILSCLSLALFPAALIYSFLSGLKSVSTSWSSLPRFRQKGVLETLPWGVLRVMLTVVNTLFLVVEIYYYVILKEDPTLRTDGLYDVFAILLIIFIGLLVVGYQITRLQRDPSKSAVALGVSLFGLILAGGFRLFTYAMYYGLWNEKALFSVVLLAFMLLLLCMLFSSRQARLWRFRSLAATLAVFLTILIVIPGGVLLSQTNAAIFLLKYNAQSLDGQSDVDAGVPLELAEHDLRLDRMADCGVNGIPALLRLASIDDVTVEGEALGLHVQNSILDCLCTDLGLIRTGDNQTDFNVVCSAADNLPRYRLPTSYAWVLQRLKESEHVFLNANT